MNIDDLFDPAYNGDDDEEQQQGATLDIPSLVSAAADKYGVPRSVALAVAFHESGFNQDAVSPKGARGVMQLMPPTAQALKVDPADLNQNIDGGVRLLAENLKRFNGDTPAAIAAYQAGAPAIARNNGKPIDASDGLSTNKQYVDAVMNLAKTKFADQPDTGQKSADPFAPDPRLASALDQSAKDVHGQKSGLERLGLHVAKGAYSAVEAVGTMIGWADQHANDLPADEANFKTAEWARQKQKEIDEELMKDPTARAAAMDMQQAKGAWETVGAMLEHPGENGVGMLADMLVPFLVTLPIGGIGAEIGVATKVGSAIARVAKPGLTKAAADALGARVGATIASSAAFGEQGAAATYNNVIETLMEKGGMSRNEAADQAEKMAAQVGAMTFALSTIGGGRASAKMITEGLDAIKGVTLKGAAVNTAEATLSNAGQLMYQHGKEVEAQQMVDPTAEPDYGKAFVQGAVPGFVMGAAGEGAAGIRAGRRVPAATPDLDAPPTEVKTPDRVITPATYDTLMPALAEAKSADEAAALVTSWLSSRKVDVGDVLSVADLSKIDTLKSAEENGLLRESVESLRDNPQARQSLLSDISTALSSVDIPQRRAAVDSVFGHLESTGRLDELQNRLNLKALEGTPEEKASIKGASDTLSTPEWQQFAANQPDNLRAAMDAMVARMNDATRPETERAAAADMLTEFAKRNKVGEVAEAPAAKAEGKPPVDREQTLAENRNLVSQIVQDPAWREHIASLSKEDRAAVIEQLNTLSNPKISTGFRNAAASMLVERARDAGVKMPDARITKPVEAAAPKAPVRTAPMADSEAARVLSKAKFGEEHGTITVADPFKFTRDNLVATKTGGVSSGQARLLQVLGRALGRDVKFFQQNGGTKHLDGFVLDDAPNTLFLNRSQSGAASLHAVMGHEFFHSMDDDLKSQFIEAVAPHLDPAKADALRQYINQPGLPKPKFMEEVAADLFGNGLNKPELISKALDDMPVSLATRIVQHVRDFIANMIDKLSGVKDFDTKNFVTDLQAIDKAWVKAFKEHLKRTGEGETPIEGRPANSFTMEELARVMDTEGHPQAEKADTEIGRRSTFPDYDAVAALAKAAGKREWNGWPVGVSREPGKKLELPQKDMVAAQIDARRRRDRGELLSPVELDLANGPDIQPNKGAKIERRMKPREEPSGKAIELPAEKKTPEADRPLTEEEQDVIRRELDEELENAEINEEVPIRYSTERKPERERPEEMSTRAPLAKGASFDPVRDFAISNLDALKSDKKTFEKNVGLVTGYENFKPGRAKTPEQQAKQFVDHVTENLLYLHDQMPAEVRERAKKWYDGANSIANKIARHNDLSDSQAAGIIAVLSPQKDWFMNANLAGRVADIMRNKQSFSWTDKMEETANRIYTSPENMKLAEQIAGKRLSELSDPMQKAAWLRAYDEAYNSRSFPVLAPEGHEVGIALTAKGAEKKVAWGSLPEIAKAVSIFEDGSIKNVSEKIGSAHKVRNFYNNILVPNSMNGHVTIDTHAVSAGLLQPLSGNTIEVTQNFGGGGAAKSYVHGLLGTYPLYAQAYQNAAEARGILPREMQSITWEAARNLFDWTQKRGNLPAQVKDIWKSYREGELSYEEARKQIVDLAGGIRRPEWDESRSVVDEGERNPADEGSLSEVELPGRGAESAGAGIASGTGRTVPRGLSASEERVSLSASTDTIPGLKRLTEAANAGDTRAHALVNDIAADHLQRLLKGTSAKVEIDRATGLFEGRAEPALSMRVNFDDAQEPKILAALAKFADNFNQKQIHVRRPVDDAVGHEYGDGSYATPSYRFTLSHELTRDQVQRVIDESGLYGLTFGKDFVEAYYVGNPQDARAVAQFVDQVGAARAALGGGVVEARRQIERLWPYGEGGIDYGRIRGDLPAQPATSVETARRVASFLRGEEVAGVEQARELTPEQSELQTRIADAFDQAPVDDLRNPNVRRAYNALRDETIRQFEAMPIKVEVFNGKGEPYKNSAEMRRDLLDNNHLFIYGTTPETFGPAGHDFRSHPMLADSGLKDINGKPLLVNDLFRAIHDYFAHGMSETQFGPKGEEAAWRNHMAATRDPWARWALTMETRGQNSWVNFHRGLDQNTPIKDRAFAEQKASLLPIEYSLTGDPAVDAPMHRLIDSLSEGDLNGSVRFSSARGAVTPSWTAPEPSRIDDLRYKLQDKQIDTKRVVDAIKTTSKGIADEFNARLKETLYHGRVAEQTKDFLDNEMKPMLQSMRAHGISIADLNEYLHNRHAEERNNQIASINPAMPDKGSGIETAEARKYLASLDPDKRRKLDAVAQRVDSIIRQTQDIMIASGLESPQTIADWRNAYGSYVPLVREGFAGRAGIGQGFSVKGSASKRAMGSERPVADILAHVAMARERTIVRAEKNRVAQALYGLAIQNPNPDFWLPVSSEKGVLGQERQLMSMGIDPAEVTNLINEPRQRMIDPISGEVKFRVNPLLRNGDNVMSARINGRDNFIFFNENDPRASRMAASLKNLDAEQMGQFLSAAGKVTRYIAAINTQYNPFFGIVNIMRDTGEAALNLSTTELAGRQAEVIGNIPAATRGVMLALREQRAGKPITSSWGNLFKEFSEAGGKTGYRDLFVTSEDRAKAIQAELNSLGQNKAKAAFNYAKDLLSDYNEALENGTRLAAYKVARDSGMSVDQAAALAKELTVNFNRKGQVAPQMGALYAFFNASVQGTSRLAETMAGPMGKKILIGGLLLGAAQHYALQAAGIEDDVPEFIKENNLILPTGGKGYIAIPLPLGFRALPSLSRLGLAYVDGGFKNGAKYTGDMLGLIADSFNPIGNAGLSLQTITPTFADPLAALAENKDWTGRPIAKKDFDSMNPTPGFTRMYSNASEVGKILAKGMNYLSGGSEYRPGLISPTPDQIDYLVQQATGGVGREAMKIEQTAKGLASGEEVPTNRIPLVGRFYGTASDNTNVSSKFYDNVTQLNTLQTEAKERLKARDDYQGFLSEHPEVRLARQADSAMREVSALRKMKTRLSESGANAARIQQLDQRISAVMNRLNQRVSDLQQ